MNLDEEQANRSSCVQCETGDRGIVDLDAVNQAVTVARGVGKASNAIRDVCEPLHDSMLLLVRSAVES